MLPLTEGNALPIFTLAEVQAHRVICSIARSGALTAVTCAVRHAFASGIDGFLALLLGSLELTVLTARTVPITAEVEQTGRDPVKWQPHSEHYGHVRGP